MAGFKKHYEEVDDERYWAGFKAELTDEEWKTVENATEIIIEDSEGNEIDAEGKEDFINTLRDWMNIADPADKHYPTDLVIKSVKCTTVIGLEIQ